MGRVQYLNSTNTIVCRVFSAATSCVRGNCETPEAKQIPTLESSLGGKETSTKMCNHVQNIFPFEPLCCTKSF